MADDPDDRLTTALPSYVAGNMLFDRAVYAIGLDGGTIRHLIKNALAGQKVTTHACTVQDLHDAMPEIERRIRLLVPPLQAHQALAKLRELLETWDTL